MKRTPIEASKPLLWLALCSLLGSTNYSRADSWGPPREFETLSENGKHVARIIPGTNDLKPVLIIFAIDNFRTNEIWKTELSNKVSPIQALITDDGNSVVTLDNYFGIGHGDDVVAFYRRNGQVAKYSLEQIAPPPKPGTDTPGWLADREYY